MNYSNVKVYYDLTFEDYLKLPGYSHSWLKREENGIVEDLKITDNITLGKLIDGILMDPGTVNMGDLLYNRAKIIANEIKIQYGDLIKHFKSQVSFTADLTYKGFTIHTKGRLDWLLEGYAVSDLKFTTAKNIDALIEFMGYKNQLWHYCKALNLNLAKFIFYSEPLKKTIIKSCDVSAEVNEFWADKCLKFGKFAA